MAGLLRKPSVLSETDSEVGKQSRQGCSGRVARSDPFLNLVCRDKIVSIMIHLRLRPLPVRQQTVIVKQPVTPAINGHSDSAAYSVALRPPGMIRKELENCHFLTNIGPVWSVVIESLERTVSNFQMPKRVEESITILKH